MIKKMYFVRENIDVIERLKNGQGIADISRDTGIPILTIYHLKKEVEFGDTIDELIDSGNIDEAINEAKELSDEYIRISKLIKIANKKGDIEEEKNLLNRILELNPNNIKAISSRIRIARHEGDNETTKKLLDRELEIEPNNLIAVVLRKIFAREEGDFETEKRLLDKEIELTPDDITAIKRRITLAIMDYDVETERNLKDVLLKK